jgi:hypothetical protein
MQYRSDISLDVMSLSSLEARLNRALDMEKASGLPPWEKQKFLGEFPEKWQHSRWIMCKEAPNIPFGYAVVSRKTPHSLHLHRLVVATPGKRIGTCAMRTLMEELAQSSRCMTVQTMADAPQLLRFYERLGFRPIVPMGENVLLFNELR